VENLFQDAFCAVLISLIKVSMESVLMVVRSRAARRCTTSYALFSRMMLPAPKYFRSHCCRAIEKGSDPCPSPLGIVTDS
jgi:hypothetical protein